MDELIQKVRELSRFTSPKGTLYPAHDGELVEVGAVISLLKSHKETDIKVIKKSEKLDKIANAWIDIEENGTPEDADDFYTAVQEILTDQPI